MDIASLPAPLRPVMGALTAAVRRREPAIRQNLARLRSENPGMSDHQLAQLLIKRTRRRLVTSAALSGAVSVAPGLGTLVALGTMTSQSVYALEQQTELVLSIAHLYGHELAETDERLVEALVVIGIAGGAVKLREDVLIAGGQQIAISALRRLPEMAVLHAGTGIAARILAKFTVSRTARMVARAIPVAIGIGVGAAFDYASATALGRAAVHYYQPGGPASRWPAAPRRFELVSP